MSKIGHQDLSAGHYDYDKARAALAPQPGSFLGGRFVPDQPAKAKRPARKAKAKAKAKARK